MLSDLEPVKGNLTRFCKILNECVMHFHIYDNGQTIWDTQRAKWKIDFVKASHPLLYVIYFLAHSWENAGREQKVSRKSNNNGWWPAPFLVSFIAVVTKLFLFSFSKQSYFASFSHTANDFDYFWSQSGIQRRVLVVFFFFLINYEYKFHNLTSIPKQLLISIFQYYFCKSWQFKWKILWMYFWKQHAIIPLEIQ